LVGIVGLSMFAGAVAQSVEIAGSRTPSRPAKSWLTAT
jgi:hypothetical protein